MISNRKYEALPNGWVRLWWENVCNPGLNIKIYLYILILYISIGVS